MRGAVVQSEESKVMSFRTCFGIYKKMLKQVQHDKKVNFPRPLRERVRERGSKKFAFTLAEVLITLGIIGVVAAMTIPTLMAKIQEKELYSAYMRVYSILNQAYLHAEEEYGDFSGWTDSEKNIVPYTYIKPFLKIAQDCSAGNGRKCFTDATYTFFDGSKMNDGSFWRNSDYPAIRLLSGESIIFLSKTHGVHFLVDLNNNKKPNQLGVDMHYFSIYQSGNNQQYKVLPGVRGGWSGSEANGYRYCMKSSVSGPHTTGTGEDEGDETWHPGSGCGFWILKHRNMDYLHMTDQQIKQNW